METKAPAAGETAAPARAALCDADYRAYVFAVRSLADGEDAFFGSLEGAPATDPEALAEFLAAHRLLSWAGPAISSPRAPTFFPPATLASLRERREAARVETDRLVGECVEIQRAFEEAGIEWMLLKGPSLGLRFYGDVHRRWQRDVDLLVHARDVERAAWALGRLGFEPEPNRIGEGAVRRGLLRGASAVDLHWNLRRRSRRRLAEDRLWADRERFALAGRPFETLSDENALVFLLISVAGDLRRGACGVRHLLDLHVILLALEPRWDWESFFARRRSEALEKPCVNVLALFLSLWRVADRFPRLAHAIERRRTLVQIRGEDEALAIARRPRGSPENHVWYRRAYPYGAAADWARRLTVDLPFTLARLSPTRAFALSPR